MSLEVSGEDRIRQNARKAAEAVQEAVKLTALDVWGNVRENSPVDHGRLAGSWQMQRLSALQYRVSTAVKYAAWVNDGTGIYGSGQPITPKRARSLVFEINGKTIFARSVKGQRGKKYVEKSIHQTEQRKNEFVSMALAKAGLV